MKIGMLAVVGVVVELGMSGVVGVGILAVVGVAMLAVIGVAVQVDMLEVV